MIVSSTFLTTESLKYFLKNKICLTATVSLIIKKKISLYIKTKMRMCANIRILFYFPCSNRSTV